MKRLRYPADCRRFLANIIRRVEAGKMDPALGGRLGYLTNILARVMEIGFQQEKISTLQERLDALEERSND